MALKENLDHVDFSDAHTVEMLHLAAYAAHCISELQQLEEWRKGYPNNIITYNEISCIRYSFKLTEHAHRKYSSVTIDQMIAKGIIKKDVWITSTSWNKEKICTYKLIDMEKSKSIAIKYAKRPPKAAYRCADKNQSAVPIHATAPEYAVHIHEHRDEYDEVETGRFRDKNRLDDDIKRQARRYIYQYMGSTFPEFLKALKGDDLLKHNIVQILELMKTNAPLLINEHYYRNFAQFAMQHRDILDYDILYGDKEG